MRGTGGYALRSPHELPLPSEWRWSVPRVPSVLSGQSLPYGYECSISVPAASVSCVERSLGVVDFIVLSLLEINPIVFFFFFYLNLTRTKRKICWDRPIILLRSNFLDNSFALVRLCFRSFSSDALQSAFPLTRALYNSYTSDRTWNT